MQFDPRAFVADTELVQEIEKRATPVDCNGGRILFEQNESAVGLYIVRSGKATMSIAAEGQNVLRIETGAGAILGLPSLLGGQPYSMTAIAQPGAQVLYINREEFTAMMTANPSLSFKILQVLAAEVRTARRALYE